MKDSEIIETPVYPSKKVDAVSTERTSEIVLLTLFVVLGIANFVNIFMGGPATTGRLLFKALLYLAIVVIAAWNRYYKTTVAGTVLLLIYILNLAAN